MDYTDDTDYTDKRMCLDFLSQWHQKIFIEVLNEAKWLKFVCLSPPIGGEFTNFNEASARTLEKFVYGLDFLVLFDQAKRTVMI
jgi:hypothetical protein